MNRWYLLGFLLAVGGCNAAFLVEGNMMYVSAAIYIIGLVIVWFSGQPIFHKLLAILVPAVMFFSVYTITNDNRVREPAAWLIPDGYSGPLYVFLEEKCGQPEQSEHEYRVYTINQEGMLFSHAPANPGLVIIPSNFYYSDGSGNRVRLQNLRDIRDTISFNPVWRDSTEQPVFAYPGESVKGRIGETKVILEYAFVGPYRESLDFIRSSPLPDGLPPELAPAVIAFRKECD